MGSDKSELAASILALRAELTSASADKASELMALFRQLESSIADQNGELKTMFGDVMRAELNGVRLP